MLNFGYKMFLEPLTSANGSDRSDSWIEAGAHMQPHIPSHKEMGG